MGSVAYNLITRLPVIGWLATAAWVFALTAVFALPERISDFSGLAAATITLAGVKRGNHRERMVLAKAVERLSQRGETDPSGEQSRLRRVQLAFPRLPL